MKEKEALEYIDSITGLGIIPGLQSITELCNRLGNPQDYLQFVHVAGTNGKGSVCSYVANALKCGGYVVGRYLSPTIFEYRERIQVNGKMISKDALGRLIEQVKGACDAMVADGFTQPTPFEVETALAFLYFLEKKCDIVVLETGMGGLMDATNLIKNTKVAVLTSISMDHMQFLGKTLSEIATQKAGILKPGCKVVCLEQQPDVCSVVEKKAEKLGCSLQYADRTKLKNVKYGLEKQRFTYGKYEKMEISLAGTYQIENAALALEVITALEEEGFPIREDKIRKGFIDTVWPGRFTVVGKKPYFIVDGAHNEDAAKRLRESIEFYFTNKRIIYIMGVLKDKEYEKIITLTHSLADHIITVTTPGNPRALPAYELAQEISKVHEKVTAADSIEEAIELSKLLAGKEDCIIAFGSLSFLGKMMKILQEDVAQKKR